MENIKPLRSNADYEWALTEVKAYFKNQPAQNSEAADRFDVLTALIEQYENEHFEIPDADPIEVLEFAIESMGKTQAELAKLIGRNRASEILNRVRPLTLDMIRTISKEWNIPVEALAAPYELARESA